MPEGKRETVVVVGATGEFGTEIVKRVAADSYDVLAVARKAPDVDSELGSLIESGEMRFCAADISDDSAIDAIRSHLSGPVRGVVHGPGVATAGGVLAAPTSALVDAVNIKVGGLVRLVRAAQDFMVSGSRVIAIGGHYGFEPTAYAATAGVANSALANVVRQYSWALGDRGITAHLLAPGPADSSRLRRVAESKAEREGTTVEAVFDSLRAESATGSFTEPGQVAWGVTMLLAPEADALAGSTLFMDSGRRKGTP